MHKIFIIALAVSMAACERLQPPYEIVQVGGQTFLMNKSTGEAKLVNGDTLVPLRLAPGADKSNPGPSPAKTWPPQSISGLDPVTLKIKTKFRDGELLYIATAQPYSGTLSKEHDALNVNASFGVIFLDQDGFQIASNVELKLFGGTRIVDDKGQAMALQWTGRRPISYESYSSIADTTYTWHGFPEPPKEKPKDPLKIPPKGEGT